MDEDDIETEAAWADMEDELDEEDDNERGS